MTVPGFESLPGRALASGTFTITREEDALMAAVVGGAPGSEPHPLWLYVATQRGIGASVAELCASAGFDVADGPMLGTVELDYGVPLRFDVAYAVEGTLLDLVRKQGRSGTFDILSYREQLVGPSGERAGSATNTFILPRPG